MLTLKQFLNELAREDVTLSPIEVSEMKERFRDKVQRMGHLQNDGSILIPIDCILDAARSMNSHSLSEAVEVITGEKAISMLQSAEALVERVGEARERKL